VDKSVLNTELMPKGTPTVLKGTSMALSITVGVEAETVIVLVTGTEELVATLT
jgi:hypothetical protein